MKIELTVEQIRRMFDATDTARLLEDERLERILRREATIPEEEDYSEYEDYHSPESSRPRQCEDCELVRSCEGCEYRT